MPEPSPSAFAEALPAPALEASAVDLAPDPGSGSRRVRLSFYVAFVLLALAVVVQGWNMLRSDESRTADAQLLDGALHQRSSARQLARLAAALHASPVARFARAEALATMLAEGARDEAALRALLQGQTDRFAASVHALEGAARTWLAASTRLREHGHALLRTPGIKGIALDGEDDGQLALATAAVEQSADAAVAGAQALVDVLRIASEERTRELQRDVRWGIVVVLGLLLALALLVVEPTARSVRRHGMRLREQAAELQRLALVAEHTSALVIISDVDDRIVWANAAFTHATGWTLAQALGKTPAALTGGDPIGPDTRKRVRQAFVQRQGIRFEWRHRGSGGRDVWLDVDLRPVSAPDGSLSSFVRVCTDITSRVLQQAKLQALWAALPTGVVVRGPEGQVIDVNPAGERMLGLATAELRDLGHAQPEWQAVRADGSAMAPSEMPGMRTLASGRALRNETMGVHTPQGDLRWLLVNTEPQCDLHGQITGVVTCFSDVSESRKLQDRLIDSARTDALTRLPNRTVVMERLERAIAHARRHPGYGFAVLFMDFDRFKQINDTLGHGAGDELLRQIARRLEAALRPGDALARLDTAAAGGGERQVAARLGGDEFVVVLEGVSDAGTVAVVSQRLLEEMAQPYTIGANPVNSSASIGVVLCAGTHGAELPVDAEDVLRNADTAMYEAKRAGRNRWVLFDDSMQQRVVRALEVENDLRRALVENELFTVYQPVVDLQKRAMVGVEALVRWRHPVRGLVPPVEFIGVAEEAGLIDAVGELVLRQACSQFVAWQQTLAAAAPRLLAVNLSRAQLERPGLVADVAAVLDDCGMNPVQLQLEVTESLAAQDDRVQQTLRELKQLGVRLALDDFGTGYSSLACLHQMPVDTVKIDRSFVQHAETVEYHRVLIEATIRVARTLGMTTVAEGIETAGQAALMQRLECDRGQGYLFSRPLEAADLQRWALEKGAVVAAVEPERADEVNTVQ